MWEVARETVCYLGVKAALDVERSIAARMKVAIALNCCGRTDFSARFAVRTYLVLRARSLPRKIVTMGGNYCDRQIMDAWEHRLRTMVDQEHMLMDI